MIRTILIVAIRIVFLAAALTVLALSVLACSGSPIAPAPVYRGWQDGACFQSPPDPRCTPLPPGCVAVIDPVKYAASKLVCPVTQ